MARRRSRSSSWIRRAGGCTPRSSTTERAYAGSRSDTAPPRGPARWRAPGSAPPRRGHRRARPSRCTGRAASAPGCAVAAARANCARVPLPKFQCRADRAAMRSVPFSPLPPMLTAISSAARYASSMASRVVSCGEGLEPEAHYCGAPSAPATASVMSSAGPGDVDRVVGAGRRGWSGPSGSGAGAVLMACRQLARGGRTGGAGGPAQLAARPEGPQLRAARGTRARHHRHPHRAHPARPVPRRWPSFPGAGQARRDRGARPRLRHRPARTSQPAQSRVSSDGRAPGVTVSPRSTANGTDRPHPGRGRCPAVYAGKCGQDPPVQGACRTARQPPRLPARKARSLYPAWVVAAQDGARLSAGFQMISQRWPSGSWKYPE